MAEQTANYQLVKPAPEEFYDRTIDNENLDKIDRAIKEAKDVAGNIDLTEIEQSIEGLKTQVTTHLEQSKYKVAGGNATAITVSIGALDDGYSITFIANGANNGAATTINGKPLYKPNTTTAPNLIKGKAYTVWYNATSDAFFIKASAEGNALASHVLAGKTFSNDNDTNLTGTIPSKGAQIYTPTTASQTITAGQYLNGVQTILGDSNLIASNIKSGVKIFGVSGTLQPKNYVERTGTGITIVTKFSIQISLGFEPVMVHIYQPGWEIGNFHITMTPNKEVIALANGTWGGTATYSEGNLTVEMGAGIFANYYQVGQWKTYAIG